MRSEKSQGIEEFSAPITVYLNLTKQCNLRCIYCFAEAVAPRRDRGDELSDEEMLSLVDQLTAARVLRYVLTGGEPFLRRELLFDILSRVTELGQAIVLTNATLIREEDARRLSQLGGKLTVLLSIDAPVEEVNSITRGPRVLAKTLQGAKRLQDQGIHPKVNCVLSRANAHLIPDLMALLEREGLRELHITNLQPVGYASQTAGLSLDRTERWDLCRGFESLTSETNLHMTLQDIGLWDGYDEMLDGLEKQGLDGRQPAHLLPCSAGIDQCAITADGWVVPCNYLTSYPCGNVREREFLDIWRSSPELARVRALRHTPVTEVSECSQCRYNVFCHGGCRAIGFAAEGHLHGFDRSCLHHEPPSVDGEGPLPVVQ